jgi:putative glycosyltransferase
MQLSIVTTIYKSESFIKKFVYKLLQGIDEIQIIDFEIIFVLDGITDNSKSLLLDLQQKTKQIKIVELSRNFGHHHALLAGTSVAKGKLIFLIDSDLEVCPTKIVEFYEEFQKNNADVVYGVSSERKGSFTKKILGAYFWKIFNSLSDTKVPENILTERIFNDKYNTELMSLGDKNLFLGGMWHWLGFKQVSININKNSRKGKSTYTFTKRMNLLTDAITSFSAKPLKIIFKIGLGITLISFTAILYFISLKVFYPEEVLSGFTSIISVLFLILGMMMSSIGLLGIYLFKIFKQVQNRPNYIIRKIYE